MFTLQKKEPHLEVEEAWKQDKLERQKVAEYLTAVMDSIRQPFVISLNAPYGTGKTFFIRNWKKQLDKQNYKTVYFNAWESDYSDDALIAFISSIREHFENDETDQKTSDLIKKGGLYVGRKVLPVLTKGILRKVIGSKTAEELMDLSDDTDSDIVDAFGEVAEEMLNRHEAIRASIESFKFYLEELVKEITDTAENEGQQKLIIFVDELDRCKPSYAIEVLECIKHLFQVKGVVFVLSIDEKQLASTIANKYGLSDGGEGYLKKFIDWQLNLPRPSAQKYAEYLFLDFALDETKKFRNDNNIRNGRLVLIDSIGVFAEAYDLSLRQISQIYTDLNLYVRSLTNGAAPESLILGLISVLRHVLPDEELKGYCMGAQSCELLLEKLEKDVSIDVLTKKLGHWHNLKMTLHSHFLNNETFEQLRSENNTLINELNDDNRQSKQGDEIHERRARHQYLSKVLSTAENRDYGIIEPASEFVYKGLEHASYLTSH
jgi:KaiC/GvpD/RAD55 family RecA-like ATPase